MRTELVGGDRAAFVQPVHHLSGNLEGRPAHRAGVGRPAHGLVLGGLEAEVGGLDAQSGIV